MTKVYIDYNQIILSYIFKYTDSYTPRNNPHLERLLPYIYFSDNLIHPIKLVTVPVKYALMNFFCFERKVTSAL